MNIYLRLTNSYDFTKSEQIISEYLIENYRTVDDLTIHELADNTLTSTTTIIRLCKKLGFRGYRDFKTQFIRDVHTYILSNHKVDLNHPFTGGESIDNVARNMAYLTKESINLTLSILDMDEIQVIVDKLINAENIVGIGVSDTFIRLLDFQNKMIKINQFVRLSLLQSDQAYLCANAGTNDIGILISYSGTTSEVINSARILKQKNIPIIAVTSNVNSPLAIYSDYLITLPSIENKFVANYSFSAQLSIEYVLNTLYALVYNKDFEINKKHFQNNNSNYLHPNK